MSDATATILQPYGKPYEFSLLDRKVLYHWIYAEMLCESLAGSCWFSFCKAERQHAVPTMCQQEAHHMCSKYRSGYCVGCCLYRERC